MIAYLFAGIIAMLPFVANAQLATIDLTNLSVMADRALTVPLSKLASDYSRDNGVTITVTYAPSFEQTVAIQEGEPADLFISAHPQSLRQLKQRGLLNLKTLSPLVRAEFAVLSNQDTPKITDASQIEDILKPPFNYVAIASPAATAEGFYGRQILDNLTDLKIPAAEMSDTEAILQQLRKTKNPMLAILFEPDALLYSDTYQMLPLDSTLHEPAIFYSAIIPGDSALLAAKFQSFLSSNIAQREFIKYRFYSAKKD